MTDRPGATKPARDAARVRFPPPFAYVTFALIGYTVQRLFGPLAVAGRFEDLHWTVFALVDFAIGCLFTGAAALRFLGTGQNPEPWKPTPELIVGGIYRITRNPMYVGMAFWQMALGFWQRNLWIVGATVGSLWLVGRVAVAPEEAYLEEKFGDAYRDYKKRVRRWI